MPRMPMIERLYRTPVVQAVAKKAGLPEPPRLTRGRVYPTLPITLATPGGGRLAAETLSLLNLTANEALRDLPELRTTGDDGRAKPPAYPTKLGALVLDVTGVRTIDELELVRQVLRPAVRALGNGGRVIVVARTETTLDDLEAISVQHSFDGIMRTIGKELRAGATANLLWTLPETTPADLASTFSFLLQGRSAYVDGQAWTIGHADTPVLSDQPYAGRIVVVTGSARGIGAAISRTFARDGATVVGVDMPASGEGLAAVMNEIKGSALQLDISTPEAGARIAAHVTSRYGDDARVFAIVHCAGILRDKLVANMDEKLWAAVLKVNLASQFAMDDALLDGRPGGIADGGRILTISSTSGWAGSRGQTNYAAAKSALIGRVRALAPRLAPRGITVNAVAPGFIVTDMTASIPFLEREMFSRMNSAQQGGKPVDVAETLAYLADPASQAVTGQVVRVCGQAILGA